MRPVLSVMIVCVVSVQALSDSDSSQTVRQLHAGRQTAEAADVGGLFQVTGSSVADLTKLLKTLVEGQLVTQKALSDLAKALSTHQQEAQRAQVLGQRCRGDSDCSDLRVDTVCGSEGRCACGESLQEVAGGACRPYPRLSEPCRQNTDCQGGTEHSACSDNVCVCGEGYVTDNNTGCRHPRLSEACTESWHCRMNTEYTICRDSKCVCWDDYWNDRDLTCLPYPNIREACNTTSECQRRSKNSTCEDGVCACLDGYLPKWYLHSSEEDVAYYDGCAKVVALGEDCLHHAGCGTTIEMYHSQNNSAYCVQNQCTCVFATLNTGRSYIDVRIHGGSDCQGGYIREDESGRLLCDAKWTPADANVLCRTFGFSGGRLRQPGEAPPLDDYHCIWYKMACSGTEQDAGKCRWSRIDADDELKPVVVNCQHDKSREE